MELFVWSRVRADVCLWSYLYRAVCLSMWICLCIEPSVVSCHCQFISVGHLCGVACIHSSLSSYWYGAVCMHQSLWSCV